MEGEEEEQEDQAPKRTKNKDEQGCADRGPNRRAEAGERSADASLVVKCQVGPGSWIVAAPGLVLDVK